MFNCYTIDSIINEVMELDLNSMFQGDFDYLKKSKSLYPNYPVLNHYIERDTKTNVFEIAVTGWDEKDISITTEDNILKISATKEVDVKKDVIYIHQSLARRPFEISFQLSKHTDIESITAKTKNGMLIINIPIKKECQPITRTINISN